MSDAPPQRPTASISELACNVCSCAQLEGVGDVGLRPTSVTSDSRLSSVAVRLLVCKACGHLQKHPNGLEQAAVDRIYAAYDPHYLSDGREQLTFPPGLPPRTRTRHVFEKCRTLLPERGRLLDVGTGHGAVLRTARQLLGDWELYGYDVGELHRAEIEALPGVVGFWSGDLANLPPIQFDAVVLWHVLEHIAEPVDILRALCRKLSPSGIVIIQVPALERNAFDLAVTDHVSHFTWQGLERVAALAGFRVVVDGRDWVHNCHSLLLRAGGVPSRTDQYDSTGEWAAAWLQRGLEEVVHAVGMDEYAMFGTGMAGLWLTTQFDRRPAFLVEEDAARVGKDVEGIPVIAPADLPDGLPVVMAFMPSSGHLIATRLRETCPGWSDRRIIVFPAAQ